MEKKLDQSGKQSPSTYKLKRKEQSPPSNMQQKVDPVASVKVTEPLPNLLNRILKLEQQMESQDNNFKGL